MRERKPRPSASSVEEAAPAAPKSPRASAPAGAEPFNLERARLLLGGESERLTDAEVERLCRELRELARLHIRLYDQAHRVEGE